MFPILLELGPITFHTYGLMVATGFLLGYALAPAQFERQGLSPSILDHLLFLLMVVAIFGARFFYFFFESRLHEIVKNPLVFLRIWEGGLVFAGGAVFVFFFLLIYSRVREVPFLALLDALVPSLLIAHALGRLGCFAAGCCYGKPTTSIFSVTFTHPASLAPLNVPIHPTQLYSSLGNFLLFLIAWRYSRKNPPSGSLWGFYLLGYGAFRFAMEFVRDDFRGALHFGLYPSQLIALVCAVIGASLLYSRNRG